MSEDGRHSPALPQAGEPASEAAIVVKRAWKGIVTIAVAVTVAIVTLVFAGAVLLVNGFIPLSGLEGRISSTIEERLGPNWQVSVGQAQLERKGGHARLSARHLLFRHTGGASFQAPEAFLGYDPISLLRGDIRLVSLDLRGVDIKLGVRQDGALVLEQNAEPAAPASTPVVGDPADWDAFAGVMNAIGILAASDGLLGSLERAGIAGARVALVDPRGNQRSGLEDVDISLERAGNGVARLNLRGRHGSRWKDLGIDVSSAPDGSRSAVVDIRRFEPSEAVALAFGNTRVTLDGLALGGKISLTQTPQGQRRIGMSVTVAPGTIDIPNSEMKPFAVDGAKLDLASDDGMASVRILAMELSAGATRLSTKGEARNENGIWRVALDGAGQLAGVDEHDKPVTIDRLDGRFEVEPAIGELRITHLALTGPGLNVVGTGEGRRVDGKGSHALRLRAVDTDMRTALAVWPAVTSPDLHAALTEMLKGGHIEEIDVALTMTHEASERLDRGLGMDDDAVAVRLKSSGVSFQPDPGLPLLVEARVEGSATGRTAQLVIPQARAQLGEGRFLTLTEGSFSVADTWAKRPDAKVGFRGTGTADALMALFAFPALRDHAPLKADAAALRGTVDLTSRIALPLVNDVSFEDVQIESTGQLSNIASDTLLGTEKLEGGNLAMTYDRGQLTIRGEGRVGGERGAIELRQDAKGRGEAGLTMTLDNAARQRRGIGPEAGISGPVQVKVVQPLGRTPEAPPRIELDLTRAAIAGAIPGFTKPAGRPGRASFTYVADKDGPDIEDLTIDAAPVLVKGRVSLDKQNAFESASLTQLRLSPGDNLSKVDIQRDGSATKITVRGAVLDARPFIRDLVSAPTPAPAAARGRARAPEPAGPDIDIDLDVPILTGFNNEAIGNAQLKLSRRGGTIRSVAFGGRIGKADISLRQVKQAGAATILLLQSENGGATLRFLDLYRRAYGGDLVLQLGDGASQDGDLMMRNFVVRDEPALRRVTASQSRTQAFDRTDPAQPQARVDVSEVPFTKMRAEFTRSDSRIDIRDAVLWGQQVGFTIKGSVDYGRDRVDIGGTFVPGYAFNNAFAQVPIVGMILGGGGQHGGLFAVNFRISGAASAPTMTINPLSAIAPGILRRFVDPLGGAPLGQNAPAATVPAPQQAPAPTPPPRPARP